MIKYHVPDNQPELINPYVRNTRLAAVAPRRAHRPLERIVFAA